MILVEQTDYEGNDLFWYLDEYNLYGILDSRIMDQVIQKKWNGKYDINKTAYDYSTPYTLLVDKYKIFATDTIFSEIYLLVLTLDHSEWTH